jgi:hypothetical protein
VYVWADEEMRCGNTPAPLRLVVEDIAGNRTPIPLRVESKVMTNALGAKAVFNEGNATLIGAEVKRLFAGGAKLYLLFASGPCVRWEAPAASMLYLWLGAEEIQKRESAAEHVGTTRTDAMAPAAAFGDGEEAEIWLGDLKSRETESRVAAAQHLGRSRSTGRAVQALIEAMNDPEGRVRFTATIALADIGRSASAALPVLEATCKDDAGRKIGPQACEAANKIRGQR